MEFNITIGAGIIENEQVIWEGVFHISNRDYYANTPLLHFDKEDQEEIDSTLWANLDDGQIFIPTSLFHSLCCRQDFHIAVGEGGNHPYLAVALTYGDPESFMIAPLTRERFWEIVMEEETPITYLGAQQ